MARLGACGVTRRYHLEQMAPFGVQAPRSCYPSWHLSRITHDPRRRQPPTTIGADQVAEPTGP